MALKDDDGSRSDLVDAARSVAVWAAIAAAVLGGGFALVKVVGTDNALRLIGIEVTTVRFAAESQCNRAREQDTQEETTGCVSDREWIRRFQKACAEGKEPDLIAVYEDGLVARVPKCPASQRDEAREALKQPVPDVRVADVIAEGQ